MVPREGGRKRAAGEREGKGERNVEGELIWPTIHYGKWGRRRI